MRKTLKQKIDESLLEIQEAQKRHDLLMEQYTAQEEKARTHRLCKRGGYVEKYLPELITLTDKQFYTYVEKAMLSNFSRRILAELNTENEIPTDPQGGDTSAQNGNNVVSKPTESAASMTIEPMQKSAGSVQDGGARGSGNAGNNTGATS